MMHLVLGANPVLAGWGQFAAIIICFFILVFVLLALVFNLVMAIALDWVHQKSELVKMLRPTVNSVNKTSEAILQGVPPSENENKIVRTIAEGPARVQTADKQVDQMADKVANVAIDFRARMVQVETIAKAFFAPQRLNPTLRPAITTTGMQDGLQFKSPGYRMLMKEQTKASGTEDITERPVVPAEPGTDVTQRMKPITSSQLKDAPSH